MTARTAAAAPGFPRVPLVAAALLIVLTIAAVAAVRWSGVDIRPPDAAAVVTRALLFEDLPDGAVAITDAASGQRVDTVVGESGFFRGTLRALARERKRAGGDASQPFELIGRADGRLTLRDPVSGALVDIESFGPTHAMTFARLLSGPTVAAGGPGR